MTTKNPVSETLEKSVLRSMMQSASEKGWANASLFDAAEQAGFKAQDVHRRFPNKNRVLIYLGQQADQSALAQKSDGTPRERLFDMLMQRLDGFQAHRDGVRAVMRSIPFDPLLGLMLTTMTESSMEWLGRAAGLDLSGLRGKLRLKGLVGLWGLLIRRWDQDDSEDLAATMTTLDRLLERAERLGLLKSEAAQHSDAAVHPNEENLSIKVK